MEGLAPVNVQCPYCWQPLEVLVDRSEPAQEYVEDCHVCCQPMLLTVNVDTAGDVTVEVQREND